jgi:hypothetical protein
MILTEGVSFVKAFAFVVLGAGRSTYINSTGKQAVLSAMYKVIKQNKPTSHIRCRYNQFLLLQKANTDIDTKCRVGIEARVRRSQCQVDRLQNSPLELPIESCSALQGHICTNIVTAIASKDFTYRVDLYLQFTLYA